jgi:hypothetical protein
VLVEPDEISVTATAEGYFTSAPLNVELNPGETREITLTEPAQGPNIARNATASASSEQAGYEAKLVNDSDLTTFWLADKDVEQWVALTWDKPTHFTAVQLRGFQNAIERSFLQKLDTDGKTWVDLENTVFVPYGVPNPNFFFPGDGVTTTGLRFAMSATDRVDSPPGVSEILVFDTPLPKP